jgi:hypothetical protein
MGGIDGALLPVVAEIYGITDLDLLLHQLAAIRDWQRESE